MTDYYKILEVPRSATQEEIKQKYRQMAKKYHPDANGNSQESEEKFKAINEAYSVLSSPDNKAEYDSGFYNEDSFYNRNRESQHTKNTNNRKWQNGGYSYTFYYTNENETKKKTHTSKHPIFSILKGAIQISFGALLMLSFMGFLPVLGIYITFLGIGNIKRGLSSLT